MRTVLVRRYTTAIEMLQGVDKAQPNRLGVNWRSLSFESVASRSAKYRPDIDGLRAIAVLAVLFFHLRASSFQGGFVGVDIFYVISGYLITSLLVRDIAERRFSIVAFYERRARRIFPALFFVLFFCISFASAVLNPSEMVKFGKALLSTTFFASNFYFWRTSRPLGYFDRDLDFEPLLHTWSLSVEEQFYLAFPLLLFILFRRTRTRGRLYLALITMASFALNLWATVHKPVLAFYWFVPRGWELLIGALLAVKAVPPIRQRVVRETAGMLGLVLTLSAPLIPITNWPFPGYIVLVPCLGAWLVIYTGEAGPSIAKSVLSFRPLVFIGIISYPLYLWHWPLMVFSEHLPLHCEVRTRVALVLVLSFALAFLSFELVERPFRGARSVLTGRQVFAFGVISTFGTAAFGAMAVLSHGLPERYDQKTRQLIAANLSRMDDFDESCSNWRTQVHTLADIRLCTLGDQHQPKIMVWGDSHVEQLYPSIKNIYAEGSLPNRGVILAAENGCLPDPQLNNTREGYHCDSFSKSVMIRAEQQDIDTVFLGFSTWWYGSNNVFCKSSGGKCLTPLSSDALTREFLSDLSAEIRDLRSRGKRTIVCIPFPIFDRGIPEVQISNAVFGRFGLSIAPKEISSPIVREQVREVAEGAGAEVFDPSEILCPGGRCLTEKNGISLYKDSSHLAGSAVSMFDGTLRDLLQKRRRGAPTLSRPYPVQIEN